MVGDAPNSLMQKSVLCISLLTGMLSDYGNPGSNPPDLIGDPRIDGLLDPGSWETGGGTLVLNWSPRNAGGTWMAVELSPRRAQWAITGLRYIARGREGARLPKHDWENHYAWRGADWYLHGSRPYSVYKR